MSSDECKPVYRLIEDSIYAPYPQDNEFAEEDYCQVVVQLLHQEQYLSYGSSSHEFAEEDSQSRSTKLEQLKESPCSA
jgi:hypothetical protein